MTELEFSAAPVEVSVRTYTLPGAAREVGISEHHIHVYIEEGFVEVQKVQGSDVWLLDDNAIQLLRRIEYLREVEHVNMAGLRLIFSLHQEVEELRAEVRRYSSFD